jgi:hypothetical protein
VAGSTWVIGATSTSPPPNRRRRLPVRPLPLRPEPPVRVDSGAVRTDAVGVAAVPGRTGAAFGAAEAAAAGAIPHVSQYPSTMDPGQLRTSQRSASRSMLAVSAS